MRTWIAIGVLSVLGATSNGVAEADEWNPPKPKPSPTGEPVVLKRTVGDAERLPTARIRTRQVHSWADDRKREIVADFDAAAAPAEADGKGRPQVNLGLDFARLAVDGDDLAPRIRAGGARVSVLAAVGGTGLVADGAAKGAETLGSLGLFVKPVGSWVLPYLPEKPVRVGETWDLPIPYFLWSIGQLGGVPADGFVTQILEAVEDHAGARCARIRTVVSLRRPQPKGMTPPAVGIGEGAALARFRGEGTTWVDLEGCLRDDVLDVVLRIENTGTRNWMEWTLHREVTAQPPTAGPLPLEWSSHMGDLPFTVGFEKGMDEAWAAGRPAMLFFTSATDRWCPLFAARTWKDKEVLEKVKAYLPVLVDADREPELRKKYTVLLLPAVVWVDAEGEALFQVVGDASLDIFRLTADTARDRAPDVEPSPSYLAATKAGDALRIATRIGDVRAALKAIREIQEIKRPKGLLEEARAADERITKSGNDALAEAKALAQAGKEAEAREALGKLKAAYGDHPVGQAAWALLRSLAEEGK